MKRIVLWACLAGATALPAAAQTVFVDQGPAWTDTLRQEYYTEDQGSRIMPLVWMRALRTADGQPFLHGSLARYGYLPMPGRSEADLPVGFTTNGSGANAAIGMTCSACHTREIDVNGTAYRLDGGPAIVDFQAFLEDLDTSVLSVLATDEAFDAFARTVLGAGASAADTATLRADLEVWSLRYHTLMDRALPDPAWGAGRLDAVSMIFNRLTGLDLGPEADHGIIADNIITADAPTRYPFLWNAAKQDHTQWPGFAENGNALLGLSRNVGEVYGVFGEFRPMKKPGILFDNDYISENSVNFEGLKVLEEWIWDIGAPKWPWTLDTALARDGEAIFNLPTADGGCAECHAKRNGEFRSLLHATYATPIKAVGTDERECQILDTRVATGLLEGAKIPLVGSALGAEAKAFDVLAISVLGAIIQHSTSLLSLDAQTAMVSSSARGEPDLSRFDDLRGAFPVEGMAPQGLVSTEAPDPGCAYEARVLDGIWAAAPYLHNGSVPTLVELLKPPADRVMSYTPGPNYDIEAVGIATEQTAFDHVITLTGCDDLASGNSNCGHDYGTALSEDQKKALLEYLKSI